MANILLEIVRICRSIYKAYLKNEKLFVNFCFVFWNFHEILKIILKKIIVIANIFPKLETVKNLVRPLSKKHRFRTSFHTQYVKGSQTLVKSGWEHFYQIFSSFWEEIIWKKSPFLKFEILVVFVNTWTADDKYTGRCCENLLFLIQRISYKQKLSLNFLFLF